MSNPNLGSELKNNGYSKEEDYFARIDADLIQNGKKVVKPSPRLDVQTSEHQNILVKFLKRLFSSY
jgi:hypothetical protein